MLPGTRVQTYRGLGTIEDQKGHQYAVRLDNLPRNKSVVSMDREPVMSIGWRYLTERDNHSEVVRLSRTLENAGIQVRVDEAHGGSYVLSVQPEDYRKALVLVEDAK
jgi:hypothetical protein